jgi:hypothetical protein
MNLDDMQALWNSPANRPADAAQRQLAERFARRLIRQRRFQAVWLVNVFVWLTLITALAVWNVVAKKVSLTAEWGVIPLLAVPWAFAVFLLRRHLKPAAPVVRGELTVTDSLRAALAAIRAQQSHLKRVGLLLAIMIPLLAVSLWQLRTTGKASPRELTSMVVFFGGALLVAGSAIAARYFASLCPQQRQLASALDELNQP